MHLFRLYPSFNSMNLKLLIGFLAASSLSAAFLVQPDDVKAAACPDLSITTLTSVDDVGDATSFNSVTGGDCSGTPDEYGVTIYKMGLCTSDPTSSVGAKPDYSSCSITYEDGDGTDADFSAGTSIGLSDSLTTRPADGTYGYAFMLLNNTFRIKAEYGPIAGVTYYSTSTSVGGSGSANTTGPATRNDVTANSFGENCDAQDTVPADAGPMTGNLLNTSQERIADDSSVSTCSGVSYILAVVNLDSPVTITESVISLDATFTVTDNGTTIYGDGSGGLVFDAGPFNVTMGVVE